MACFGLFKGFFDNDKNIKYYLKVKSQSMKCVIKNTRFVKCCLGICACGRINSLLPSTMSGIRQEISIWHERLITTDVNRQKTASPDLPIMKSIFLKGEFVA